MQDNPLHAIRDTPGSGRGVFAKQFISASAQLLQTSCIAACVIHRSYRREVCAWCFAYDRGTSWPVRDVEIGLVWCSIVCHESWHIAYGDLGYDAVVAVEKLLKTNRRKSEDEDIAMLDADELARPTVEAMQHAWRIAEENGKDILTVRAAKKRTKADTKILRAISGVPIDHSILYYMLVAVLFSEGADWDQMLQLAKAEQPYQFQALLDQHLAAYLHLLCILPEPLLERVTQHNLYSLVSRDAHNAFGIRSLDDGSELLGHGIWPEASYWNHSCEPNVGKKRYGRMWEFWALRDVEEGEELCITYLGGDEETLELNERRKRLKDEWSFDCCCTKCDRDISAHQQ